VFIARHPDDAGVTGRQPSLWRLPQMRALAAVTALAFTGYFLTLGCLPQYAVGTGTPKSVSSLPITAMLAATVLAQVLVPRLLRRVGDTAALVIALILLGAPSPLYMLHTHRS
jgi:cyanate permease